MRYVSTISGSVGIDWSPHPTKEEVQQEYERIWRQIGRRPIEELVDLPLMTDPASRATLDVLTAVVRPRYLPTRICSVSSSAGWSNLSLEHGNSDGSCFAYVWFGMLLGPRFGDYRAGFRFGKLGLELVEQRGLDRFQARVYLDFGHSRYSLDEPIRTGRDLVRRAFDAANKTGDLTFAAYSCNALTTNLLASGDPLGEVQREAEQGSTSRGKRGSVLVIDLITIQLGLIRTLRGLTPKFGSFNDDRVRRGPVRGSIWPRTRVWRIAACWYWIRKLQARFFAGDYASAIAAASKAQPLLWTSPSFFEAAEYHFYGAL